MESIKRKERSRSIRTSQLSTSNDDAHVAAEKTAQRRRENQQLVLYILVCCTVALAWVLGTWQLSFFWVFCLAVMIFFVWKGRVLSLTEQYIKEKELLMHRKRALRQNETTEWLNFIINRWWVFSASTISDVMKKKVDPLLMDVMPSYLESLELDSLSFGDKTPFIKFIQVYECMDGVGGGQRPLSLSVITQPPPGLQQAHQFQLVLEADVGLQCDDFLMIFQAKLARGGLGTLDIAVEKLNVSGLVQVIVRLDMDAPFPHLASASVSFLERPDVSFSIRMLKAVPVTDIPFLKSWIYHLVMNGISEALVNPGKLDFTTKSTGPTKILSKPAPKALAIGILSFTINGEFQKAQEKGKKEKTSQSNHLDLMDDSRLCMVHLGNQESCMQIAVRTEPWTHSDSFLVYNFKIDKLSISAKSQILLTTQTIAKFEMALSSLLFDQNQSCSLPLNKPIDENEILKIGLSLKYTPLPEIEKSIEQGTLDMSASNSAAGVLYLCLHNATNVLGLDSNGFSDPYCVIYIGGKKLKSTHYIPRTRNPKWDVCAEVIVKDISKTVVSFVVYDWDGWNSSEDDFLGSAHIILSQERPVIIRKNLNLGCHLTTHDASEEGKLGTICVTAIFTAVASIRPSEGSVTRLPSPSRTVGQPPAPLTDNKPPKTKKSLPTAPGFVGTVEIQILQAKNLVSMDRNGYSDPFCEIKVGGRKRHVTSVKKKTLNPVWNELLTTDLPKQNENLEIIVWDQDVFFQKDFLGSLSFTLQDLVQYSRSTQHDGWHPLQRIASGLIQLRFKVDMANDPLIEGNHSSHKEQLDTSLSINSDKSVSSKTNTIRNQSQLGDSISLHEVKNDVKSDLVPSSSSHQLHRKFPDTLPRVRKTMSEAAVNGGTPDQKNDKSETSSVRLNMSDNNTTTSVSASTCDFYYGVHGHILCLTGLQESVSQAYFKVRLISPVDEARRKPSAGHVIAKSTEFHVIPNLKLDVHFEVDNGRGVHKKSTVMFDVKSGHYSHIAKRGYMLEELFKGENNTCTKWLELNSGVKMQVKMSYDGMLASQTQLTNAPRSHSFLGGLRPSVLKKIKEL